MKYFFGKNQSAEISRLLEEKLKISKEHLRSVVKDVKEKNVSFIEALCDHKIAPTADLMAVLSEGYGLPYMKLEGRTIALPVLHLIPKEVAEQHGVVIFKKIQNEIHVATTDPENTQTIDFIRKSTGFEPQVFITSPNDLLAAYRKYSVNLSDEFAVIIENSLHEALAVQDSAEKMAQFVPVIKMVNAIIDRAVTQKASDIHIESFSNSVNIRFRIDGMLHQVVSLPKELLPALVARLKLMSNLKIDEHRKPQDGRLKFMQGNKELAIRVSAIPTLHGTKMVLRLLESKKKGYTLGDLGFNKRDLKIVKDEVQKTQGMILVAGPTGSGKTTTLYALIQMLNKEVVNICTVEDPIEYGIDGINQTPINKDGGITFASGLRSLLRQDPNILMVGEIRDGETADISVNAAMTGHLLLSTFHANTAFLTPQRLVEMSIQPYLLAPVLNVIIGQRLVRKICKYCQYSGFVSSKKFERYHECFDLHGALARFKELGLMAPEDTLDTIKVLQSRGCVRCANTGFSGRIGIYEVVRMTEELRRLIIKGVSDSEFQKQAQREGALTMEEDGLLKVFKRITTFEEVSRVTRV